MCPRFPADRGTTGALAELFNWFTRARDAYFAQPSILFEATTLGLALLVGFQAAGTRGRALAEGARQVKLLGHYLPVRAEVVDLPSFSVHADHDELLAWLGTAPREPSAVYVVHGEPEGSAALAEAVADRFGWTAVVPTYQERVTVP